MQPTRQKGAQHYSKRMPDRVLRGPAAPGAKLSAREITELCESFDQDASQTWLAKKYKVSRITIWRHLKAQGRL